MQPVNYKHISATGNLSIAPAAHPQLVSINVNTGAASAVFTVYDGIDNTGTVIATIDASVTKSFWFGGVRAHAGLFAVLSGGNADITVSFI